MLQLLFIQSFIFLIVRMDWCYPMMLVGKSEGVVETITVNQVIDKEHTIFDNYVKCVLDGVIFYLHISKKNYEKILCG